MMPEPYDSTLDTLKHISDVRRLITSCILELMRRGDKHDESKLYPPEKDILDKVVPEIRGHAYGTQGYKDGTAKLGEMLVHHYANTRHHFESHANGVRDMNLIDLLELACDVVAAATARDPEGKVRLEPMFERHKLDGDTQHLLRNTVAWLLEQRAARSS